MLPLNKIHPGIPRHREVRKKYDSKARTEFIWIRVVTVNTVINVHRAENFSTRRGIINSSKAFCSVQGFRFVPKFIKRHVKYLTAVGYF